MNNKIPKYLTDKGFTKALSGLVACHSDVEDIIFGKIYILTDFNKIDNFEKNNILVTGQTNPECVPAMEKAKAVLTERGGILCHAAIVSRDLNIPCIVGIKDLLKSIKHSQKIAISLKNNCIYFN